MPNGDLHRHECDLTAHVFGGQWCKITEMPEIVKCGCGNDIVPELSGDTAYYSVKCIKCRVTELCRSIG